MKLISLPIPYLDKRIVLTAHHSPFSTGYTLEVVHEQIPQALQELVGAALTDLGRSLQAAFSPDSADIDMTDELDEELPRILLSPERLDEAIPVGGEEEGIQVPILKADFPAPAELGEGYDESESE